MKKDLPISKLLNNDIRYYNHKNVCGCIKTKEGYIFSIGCKSFVSATKEMYEENETNNNKGSK